MGGSFSPEGLSLPGIDVDLPPITREGAEHIRFGVKHDVDFIAASFVRKAEHVEAVRQIVRGRGTQHCAVESNAGLRNIDGIVAASDGIMVAEVTWV